MVIDIDNMKKIKPVKSRLFLCKPNRETIAELHDAYAKRIKFASNGIDELTFLVPYKVMRNNKYKRNPHIDNIKGHYLIRYEEGNYKSYFIINKPTKSSDNGINVKEVSCFLLPYELNNKIVRNYKDTKKLYDSVGTDGILNDTLLRRTDWSVGYIDVDIALKYRTFDVSEKTMLDFMNEIQDAYDCIILWDTVNKQINFYKSNNLGTNKGLSIEYGKYLKAITEEPDFDNVVTRLFIYGKDGISINKYNPAGTDYLESFAYYMHPFERDVNRNVLKKSAYMSDELCHAILDYQILLQTKDNEFKILLDQKENKDAQIVQKQNELFVLQVELEIIEDNLATANATGQPTATLIQQKINKEVEINAKNAEITQIENEIQTINNQINVIKNQISIENNFTPQLIVERDQYIKEKVWSNDHYFDEEELYKEGSEQLQKIHQPMISYKIDIVDLLKVVACKKDWNKLNKYDIITIKYPEFNINIKAKIIEIDRDDDGNSINLTISNANDIKNGFIEYKDLIAKFTSSSTRVDMSKFKWDETESNTNEINQIINNTWDANKRRITAGVNESVEISRKGIVITNPDFPNEMVVMNAGVVGVSSDFGNTFKNAITKNGIVGERIFGRILAGTNLTIDASDKDGQRTFTVDENGVTIKGAALIIEDGLSPDQLDPSFKNSLVELNKSYTNGIRIDTTSGLVVTRSDEKIRSVFNATDGIRIQKNIGTSLSPNWMNSLYADTDGTLMVRGLKVKNTSNVDTFTVDDNGNVSIRGNITMTGGSISWDSVGKPSYTSEELFDLGALSTNWVGTTFINANGVYTGKITTNQIEAGTAKITTAMIENLVVGSNVTMGSNAQISWNNVTNQPTIPTVPSYITSTKITATTIESPTITGGSITSNTTINVGTNATIGEKLILSGTVGSREITFSSGARITTPSSTSLYISASTIQLDNAQILGSCTVGGNSVLTSGSGTAYDSSRLGGVLSSSYSRTNHTHSEYASSTHDHGATYVRPQFSQNLSLWYNSSTGNLGVYVNGSLVKSI